MTECSTVSTLQLQLLESRWARQPDSFLSTFLASGNWLMFPTDIWWHLGTEYFFFFSGRIVCGSVLEMSQ